VSNMFQGKGVRFAFMLGTETDADPQNETGFEFGSGLDYETSYINNYEKYRQQCSNLYLM
jgi:hypothetical protein